MSPKPNKGAPGEGTYKRRKMPGKLREPTSPTSAKNNRYAGTGTLERQNGDQYKGRRMSVPSPAACNSESKDARIQPSTRQRGKKRAAATTRNGNTDRKNFIGETTATHCPADNRPRPQARGLWEHRPPDRHKNGGTSTGKFLRQLLKTENYS